MDARAPSAAGRPPLDTPTGASETGTSAPGASVPGASAPGASGAGHGRGRLQGIDVARGLAVLGMVVVNIRLVTAPHDDRPSWLRLATGLLDGRSAATFVLVAGMGSGLAYRAATAAGTHPRGVPAVGRLRRRLLSRAVFLFVTGMLLLSPVIGWTADILHLYGIHLLLGALLLTASDRVLLGVAVASAAGAAVLVLTRDHFAHWDLSTLEYDGLLTPEGFLRNLFLDGFHPVVGWSTLYLLGLWWGRRDLRDPVLRRRLAVGAVSVVAVTETLSRVVVGPRGVNIPDLPPGDPRWLLSVEPVPPGPAYLLAGGGTAVLVVLASLRLVEILPARALEPLSRTGRAALTLYVAHVVLGMGTLEATGRLGDQSLEFAVGAALVIDAVAVAGAWLLLRRRRNAPLEALMRRLGP